MISLSSKTVKTITKVGVLSLALYTFVYTFYKAGTYYKAYYEKVTIEKELELKRNETTSLKRQIEVLKKKMEDTEKKYISKEELEVKVKDIFKRMSVLDYSLKYLDSKRICVDRYILVTQLVSQSEKGTIAGEGILSYIGEMKKSTKNPSIYFVDYVTKSRESK